MKSKITPEEFKSKIGPIQIGYHEIQNSISVAAKEINKWYRGKPIVFIGLLTGSVVFAVDLLKHVSLPCMIKFIEAKSYVGDKSSGTVNLSGLNGLDIEDCDVIVIEDIVDTGRTITKVLSELSKLNPASIKVVTLLDKPSKRVVEYAPDLVLFTIPDVFVIGYGLDYNGLYRNMKNIRTYISDTESL